ncbi:phytanoyl-CoA dioxygenase family protein [Inhella proteolytica]|uniref:Phytanoyl-CoA dioxygenase family protein n=1 Tax=Inhella proteolytica TaxID=2795029 RepID=A0A931NFX3_9BURK|nr:phytanoyl-CoA dioxygenase family protein [Inhella proteolytica]MBH9576093.1 phytanoyl-CoA dioxygenase family protein [Inhella proteolytica]
MNAVAEIGAQPWVGAGLRPEQLAWYDRPGWQSDPRFATATAEQRAGLLALHEQGWFKTRLNLLQHSADAVDAAWREAAAQGLSVQIDSDSLGRSLDWAELLELEAQRVPLSWRLVNAQQQLLALAELVAHPQLQAWMACLVGAEPQLLKCSYFYRGSQARPHADMPYAPIPAPGALLTLWLALEDADAGNGALTVFPGSHRRLRGFDAGGGSLLLADTDPDSAQARAYLDHVEAELARAAIAPVIQTLRAGQLVVLHAATVHGGVPITDWQRTRRSLVLHVGRQTV